MNIGKTYKDYLDKVSGLSSKTISKYYNQVPAQYDVISIIKKHSGSMNLFSVTDLDVLAKIYEEVKALPVDIDGNNMYSCGIKAYIKFLKTPIVKLIGIL